MGRVDALVKLFQSKLYLKQKPDKVHEFADKMFDRLEEAFEGWDAADRAWFLCYWEELDAFRVQRISCA